MLTQEMKTELVSGILEIFGENVQQIILYGSVARKEEKEDSDVDIAVIVEKGFHAKNRERFVAWAAEMDMKYEKVFSIIDVERSNLERWGKILPFYKSLIEEGIVLWKVA